jgi:hypothetical protein
MTSRIHAVLPRLAIALFLLGVIGAIPLYRALTKTYEIPDGRDIFSVVEGTWALPPSESRCTRDHQVISFTSGHQTMIVTYSRPYRVPGGTFDSLAFYDVLRTTRSSIRGALRGSSRYSPDGEPIVWDLVVRDPDRVTWHYAKWPDWIHTKSLLRCPLRPAKPQP